MTAVLTGDAVALLPGQGAQLDACLGRLTRGPADLTMRATASGWYRATTTPAGPALLELVATGADVQVRGWGEGAVWAVAQAPRLLGADDDPRPFLAQLRCALAKGSTGSSANVPTITSTGHPSPPIQFNHMSPSAPGTSPAGRPDDFIGQASAVLARALSAHPGLRIGATDNLIEAIVPAIIEQRVTGTEAFASIRDLIRHFSQPAPGPAQLVGHPAYGMYTPLTAQQWARLSSWEFTRHGVDAHRGRTIAGVARREVALSRALSRADPAQRPALLSCLPGIGPWTAAKTLQQVFGDPDAWSDGDYHVPGLITQTLISRKLSNDECRDLLANWAGQRYRVELMVTALVGYPERHGPRRPLPTHVPGVGVLR